MNPPEELEASEPRRALPRAWDAYAVELLPGGEKEWEFRGEVVPGERESDGG